MVLSNKKLKQKIRSLLAESVATAESGKPLGDGTGAEDVKQQLQSLKEVLSSKSHQRPRPTRRAGKRNKPSSSEDPDAEAGAADQEEGGGTGGSPDLSNKKKKRKKSKRGGEEEEEEEGEGAAESSGPKREEEGEEGEKKNKEKKKKNKNKKKKKKKGKKNTDGGDNEDGRTNGGGEATDTAAMDTREENGDAVRKVYVGGIPYYSTEDDIRSFFEGCGTVTEVDCMAFPETGKFRGIAILTFKTEAAAKRALALDGADMGGLYLKIQPYKATRTQQKTDFSPEVIHGYNRIYVGNLSWDIAEDDLRKLFSECKISSIRWGEDKVTGEFKGFAHVDFQDSPSLALALKLDQMVICGRPVRIRCAVPKKGTETKQTPKPASESNGDADTSSGGAKKKKRQTCYECGIPGHLSSSCPNKKSVEAAGGSS